MDNFTVKRKSKFGLYYVIAYICKAKANNMKAKFELKTWMTENRELVISEYNKMTTNQFFSGIPLKDFMYMVYNNMSINNIRSEKRASEMLPRLIERVVSDNINIEVLRDRDAELASKYKGTAYMSLI